MAVSDAGRYEEAIQLPETAGRVKLIQQLRKRLFGEMFMKWNWTVYLEFGVLVVAMLIVWVLFSLPIVFYYLSSSQVRFASLIFYYVFSLAWCIVV